MKRQLLRLTISALASFNALSAIGGGIALLLGTYQDGVLIEAGGHARFPLEWLRQTPFSDYTIPAIILTVGVGGSSLLAVVLVWTSRDVGALASMVAGLVMAGYIVVEVELLKQGDALLERLYFGLGLLTCGLATYLWITEFRRHRSHHQIHAGRKKGQTSF